MTHLWTFMPTFLLPYAGRSFNKQRSHGTQRRCNRQVPQGTVTG